MTINELSQLYWLRLEINNMDDRISRMYKDMLNSNKRLQDIRSSIDSIKSQLGGNGTHVKGDHSDATSNAALHLIRASDRLNSRLVLMNKLLAEIEGKRQESVAEEIRLTQFINSVEDPKTRVILNLRFVDGLSWGAVAERVSCDAEPATDISVRVHCFRFLKSTESDTPEAL